MKLIVTGENAESLYSSFAEQIYQQEHKNFSLIVKCRRCGTGDEYRIPHFVRENDLNLFRDVMNNIYSAAEEMGIQDHILKTIYSKIIAAKAIN